MWCGMLLWIALLGPLPKPAWFTNWGRLGYVVLIRFAGAALANVFIWSQTVFCPIYRATDARAGLNPLSDENVAGALMMVEQLLLTVGLLAWFSSAWPRRTRNASDCSTSPPSAACR